MGTANSRETSIKRASETETLVALPVRAFFYTAVLRLLNIESFLQFNGALLCQVKPSFRNTRVLKDEPSLVFSFQLYLPYASEVIVPLLDDGQQRLNPENGLAVRHCAGGSGTSIGCVSSVGIGAHGAGT